MEMAEINILLQNTKISSNELNRLIGNIIKDEVEIVVTDPGYLKVLNRKYRRINSATDVLSFDLSVDDDGRPDGIIYVDGRLCPPIEAVLERIFHGYLHLRGYSHNSEDDAAAMNRQVGVLVKKALGNR